MTHDELPHGLGIRDEELEEATARRSGSTTAT